MNKRQQKKLRKARRFLLDSLRKIGENAKKTADAFFEAFRKASAPQKQKS